MFAEIARLWLMSRKCHLATPYMLSCSLLTHAVSIENKTKDFIRYANFLHLNFGAWSPVVMSSQNILHVINLWCCTRLECPEFHSTLTPLQISSARMKTFSRTALTQRTASVESIYRCRCQCSCPFLLVQVVLCSTDTVSWCLSWL